MTLLELGAKFLKITSPTSFLRTEELVGADGVIFLCPKCFVSNRGPVGTHSVICWKPSVPLTIGPGPGRWNLVGTSLADLTLTAGSSSVALTGGCAAHFFVRNGVIVDA